MQHCVPGPVDANEDFQQEAAFFKALGDPHRLTILATILRAPEPVCVCDFTAQLPLNQPTVSHHLRVLRKQGIIKGERRGTWVYYSLCSDIKADAARLLQSLETPKARKRSRAS